MSGAATAFEAPPGPRLRHCRRLLGDILVAHCLRVHPRWLDVIQDAEPDGGVRARLDALAEAVELAGPDEWLLRAWIIGAEPGERPPAELVRDGDLGTFRALAGQGLEDPERVMSPALSAAKQALEEIGRSGLTGLGWFQSHLTSLRALVAEHEQLLKRPRD